MPRYAHLRYVNIIQRQIGSTIAKAGSARKGLELLQRGLFRRLRIIQNILGVVAVMGLLGMLIVVVGFVVVAACYWLDLLPPQSAETIAGHPIFGQLLFCAFLGMGLSTCLLPLIIIIQRQNRLIVDFVGSVADVRDDGTLVLPGQRYAVYLRSFDAEQHALMQTYTMMVGFEGGVRQQMHPSYFIKQSIASLRPDIFVVYGEITNEALSSQPGGDADLQASRV